MRYTPGPVPLDTTKFSKYLTDELRKISAAFGLGNEGRLVNKYVNPPNHPEDGQIVFADGNSWDPGEGKGYYWFDSDTGNWNKMG